MPATTYVTDADFITPDVDCIREWLVQAESALGKKIAVQRSRTPQRKRWWERPKPPLYMVMVDLGGSGARQAQIINFASRDGSTWSINLAVPAQEVAAWLMGIVTGHEAALAKEGK